MPSFKYKGIGPDGKTISGELEAGDRKGAVRQLIADRIKPIAVNAVQKQEVDVSSESADFFQSERKTSTKAAKGRFYSKPKLVLGFLEKLLVLLSSGLPLGDSLKLLSARLSEPRQKELSLDLWRKISEGKTLSAAMSERSDLFSESQTQLIAAGEARGHLVSVLERIVSHLQETTELRKAILSSLTYPVFICFVAFAVVIFFLSFLLPKIRGMLDTLGSELQWFAAALLVISDFAVKFGPFFLAGLVVLAAAILQWRRTKTGKATTDLWLLRLPFIGRINLFSSIYETTSLMSTLLGSGVNTTETLRLVERTINNTRLRAKFNVARKQIQEGVSMATAIKRVKYMPDLAMDILTVGENTGNMVNSLRDINRIYRGELTQALRFLTNAVSTGALIFAFSLVAIIAVSIVMSVMQVSQALIN